MENFRPERFFDFADSHAAPLLERVEYVWEAVRDLPAFIAKILEPAILGEVEEGAWVEPGAVRLEAGSRVERGAVVRGPTIIGAGAVVRSGAHVRGDVVIDRDCVVGTAVEVRCAILLAGSEVLHSSFVGTSILGRCVRLGGLATLASYRMDEKEIAVVFTDADGKHAFPTGLRHLGAIVGDDSIVGSLAVLQPGTLVGRGCELEPLATVSGFIPDHSYVGSSASMVVEVGARGQP